MSDNNMFLNLGYDDLSKKTIFSIVDTQKKMVEIVTRGFKKEGRWLDAGSGTGAPACYLANSYPSINIEGINIVKTQIEKANDLAKNKNCDDRVKFNYGNAQDIPYSDNHFENIYAIESAFHFEDKTKFISESKRVLKQQGQISIADIVIRPEYLKFRDWYKVSIAKHGLATKEFYNKDKWVSLLSNIGFDNVKVEDITLNVSNVLPHWVSQIKKNHDKLLDLYPKIFLTMLCRCLEYAYNMGDKCPFGYHLITATKEN
jgi:ubiquinone/menaquinone biosynthesis C-methylase UbiE